MNIKIQIEDLEDIARGAAFLGAGGGGDPLVGRLLAQQAILEFGAPEVITLDQLADDAAVYSAAMFGSPPVILEKGAVGEDVDIAIRAMEKHLGRKADAIIPMEMGGINSMIPIMAAARLGLPLIDADGMGRAFPELQMVTFNIFGVSATPMTIVDDHLNVAVIETTTCKRAEEMARVLVTEMGASAMTSEYPMTGKQAKASAVRGTLTLAQGIGRAILQGRENNEPVESLLTYLRSTEYYNQCKVLFDGKVSDIRREITKGWSVGHCILEAMDGSSDQMEVLFQNEHLVARKNGKTVVIVPDLVCLVDRETGEPVPAEHLRYGQRLKVIGTSAASIMRSPEALKIFGPRAFGFDEDFVPLENL